MKFQSFLITNEKSCYPPDIFLIVFSDLLEVNNQLKTKNERLERAYK